MITLFFSLLLLGSLFAGNGCLLSRLLRIDELRNPALYLWLGISLTGSAAMFVSLFLPLNGFVLLVFVLLGLIGLLLGRKNFSGLLQGLKKIETKIFFSLLGLFLLCLASLGSYTEWTASTGSADTNGYHLPIVQIYNEYGTLAGIGNVEARLAFNSIWHSVAAVLDNGLWDNRSAWLMPCLYLFGGFLYFLYEFCFASSNGVRAYALTVMVWLGLTTIHVSPTLYYDNPVQIFNLIAVLEVFYVLQRLRDNGGQIANAAVIVLLGAGAFLVKPIGAVCLFFASLLGLIVLAKCERNIRWQGLVKIYGLPGCFLLIWIVRNIIQSGYPFFPLPLLALPLDWTVPFAQTLGNYNAVVGWARMAGANYWLSLENGFWYWFKPWLVNNLKSTTLAPMVVCSAALWWKALRGTKTFPLFYLFFWSLLSILYWFCSAPDFPRFGEGFFWQAIAAAWLFLVPDNLEFNVKAFWQNSLWRTVFFSGCALAVIGSLLIGLFYPLRSLWRIGQTGVYSASEYIASGNFGRWDISGLERRDPREMAAGFRPRRR
jgi:hypothetical protein